MGRGALGALVVALGLAFAGPLAAQPLPAQYSVTGVAADDVLNIRAEPSSSAPIVGSLGPYSINVEVLELTADMGWGWVGLPEGNGWVSMRYLERQEVIADSIPRPLTCGGTEPFWSLGLYAGGEEYATPDGRLDLTLISENLAHDGFMATLSGVDGSDWTMLVDRTYCSDGMSDRTYGFQTLVYMSGGDGPLTADGPMLLSGCCSLQGN